MNRHKATLVVALAWLACALAAPPARGAVYWNSGTTIGAANMDGTTPQEFFYPLITGPGWVAPGCGVAVDDTHLYWRGSEIARVSLDGSPAAEPIVRSLGQSCGFAIDGSHVYWTDPEGKSIGRAGLDGAGANGAFITDVYEPCGLAVDNRYVYWTGWWGIGRARLDGSEVDREFIVTKIGRPCGLAVDDTHIYWGKYNGSEIGRANTDGGDVEEVFISGTGPIHGLAVNSTHLFWANDLYDGFNGAIGRANLDGSGVEQAWIPQLRTNYFGVAVDSRPEPPPISLRIPSRAISFKKITHNRHNGVVYVDVVVPARGELVVTKPRIGWKVLKGNPPSWVGGVFTWHLKLWPGRRGSTSTRIKAQLNRKGGAPVDLHLAYAEENRGPTFARRLIFFKRKTRPGASPQRPQR